jgi:hypothetical protein
VRTPSAGIYVDTSNDTQIIIQTNSNALAGAAHDDVSYVWANATLYCCREYGVVRHRESDSGP